VAWWTDLETALRQVESSVQVERLEEETIRVSLPRGPGMRIKAEYFEATREEGSTEHMSAYAERIIEKLKKEGGK